MRQNKNYINPVRQSITAADFCRVCSVFNNESDRDNMPPALRWWYVTFTLDESTLYPVRRQVSVFARVKAKYPWRKARGMNFKINATEQKLHKPGTTINHRFGAIQADPPRQCVTRREPSNEQSLWWRSPRNVTFFACSASFNS